MTSGTETGGVTGTQDKGPFRKAQADSRKGAEMGKALLASDWAAAERQPSGS
ncbi:hypothetical protein ACFQ6S_08465 [Streptomyces sp. NPDC056479]|uniref:hypothetical protein n=1 Tax=Streptomyces sp. NPDC056479 TaxID=3345832 RepID=UPI0036CEDDAD